MKTICRVIRDASHAHRATEDALGALRRFRQATARCARCPKSRDCRYRADFNAVIDALLEEINDEWSIVLSR